MSSRRELRDPEYRVVVLGASNVTRGLRAFCRTAGRLWGQPIDVFAAIGHGRSYGITTCVFGRTLPSIRECELWEEWSRAKPLPTAGLITDIGNDIVYGAAPAEIVKWIQECAERLRDRCERIVLTGLPLASLTALEPRRFLLMRSILFPRSRLTFEEALARAQELDQRLEELAQSLELARTSPDASWYGIDPIHVRRKHTQLAWESLLVPWCDEQQPLESGGLVELGWRKLLLRPKHEWLLGWERYHPQPAWVGPDGSQVSLY